MEIQSIKTEHRSGEGGFGLVEAVIALLIIMIGLLAVFNVFTYAITYNTGNKARSDALTVLQQEVERYRAAKFNAGSPTDNFTPGTLDNGRRDLTGGVKAQRTVSTVDGNAFHVDVSVDNDPNVPLIQPESYVCLSPQGTALPACTLKEITITVTFAAPTPGWQTAVPSTVILRRVRGN